MKEKIYKLIAHTGINFMQKVFPEYFAVEPMKPTDRYIEYPFVLKNLPTYKKTKILDVGCSGSMFPLILKSLGYEVWGIDIRNYPDSGFNFIKGSISDVLFSANQFDCITAISTIEHIGLKRYGQIENPEEDISAIKEIHRILKPKGLFLMTVPFNTNYQINKNHRIYNCESLNYLLSNFEYNYEIKKSPEADYEIALIRSIK